MADPTVETKIWLALKARLDGLAALLGLPISLPNQSFTAPSTGYMRVSHVPNSPGRFLHGSLAPSARYGVVQVMLMTPPNQALAVPTNLAGRIAAHFPQDLPMRYSDVTVRVRQQPNVGQVTPAGAFTETAVNIPYLCFA